MPRSSCREAEEEERTLSVGRRHCGAEPQPALQTDPETCVKIRSGLSSLFSISFMNPSNLAEQHLVGTAVYFPWVDGIGIRDRCIIIRSDMTEQTSIGIEM